MTVMKDSDLKDCTERCRAYAGWLLLRCNWRVRVRVDVDDLANVGLLACFESLKDFDGEHRLWSFARRSACFAMAGLVRTNHRRECVDGLFKHVGNDAPDGDEYTLLEPSRGCVIRETENRLDVEKVLKLCQKRRHRKLLELTYLMGMTDEEVSKKMKMTRTGVSNMRARVLMYLRESLSVNP